MASLNSFGPSSPPQPRFSKVNDYTLDKGFKEWDLLDSSTDHAIIKHHKLYKFVETKAPDDYVTSDEPIHVMWLDRTETEDAAWNAIASTGILSQATKADGSQIQKSDVNFIPYGGGSIYVPNAYSKLTVKKAWTASDGTALADAPAGSVKVNLYQDVTQVNGWIVTAHCSANGNNYQTSQVVKKGSPITIAFAQWAQSANAEISLDGGNSWQAMHYDTTSGLWKYTIDSIASDMTDIQLTFQSGSEWAIKDPLLSDFVKPADTDKQVSSTPYGTVTLKKSDGCSHSWTELPATDGAGHEYTYHVEEENVPSGFKAIYLGNGIATGTITITNQKMVQLPETGGTGAGLPAVAGAALAASAAAGLILLRKAGAARRR